MEEKNIVEEGFVKVFGEDFRKRKNLKKKNWIIFAIIEEEITDAIKVAGYYESIYKDMSTDEICAFYEGVIKRYKKAILAKIGDDWEDDLVACVEDEMKHIRSQGF